MSVLVPAQPAAPGPDDAGAGERFTALQVDGEWTVWDAELELRVVHQARWDAEAAGDVAGMLRRHPGYVHLFEWSIP